MAPARAQAPTGTISGVVTDSAGAPVGGVRLRLTNRDSGLTRNLTTPAEGDYNAAALPPGFYLVAVEADGFGALERVAAVETGATTTLNITLRVAGINEQVTLSAASPLMQYEQHQVGGGVGREQIEGLPLNGRNFLELAKLEPGVVPAADGGEFLSVLGAGLSSPPRIGNTRVTVDGVSVGGIGTIGTAMQVSQEVVQEFQLSTVSFDPSTSLTSNGAVNIVTRSGGNDFHGGAFYVYRDHNLDAYPGLRREAGNPDPFFRRGQFGFNVGGPVRRDRAFFFAAYERNDQRGVASVQPATPEFAPLGGVFPTSSLGDRFNLRLDARLGPGHNAFARYTRDANNSLGGGINILPSGWPRSLGRANQSVAGLTSVLSPAVVNDLRLSYFFSNEAETPAGPGDCRGCVGAGGPAVNIPNAGVSLGNARRTTGVYRRHQLTDSLVWQKGNHRFRFGFDWEHATRSNQLLTNEPVTIELYSPQQVRHYNATAPPAAQIPLPSSFLTLEDILRLPLRSFLTSVGSGLELQRDFRPHRVLDLYRLYAADTWRIHPRLTLNFGLAWSYEPHSLNTDLSKPRLLTAILGPDGLGPPSAQITVFSPTAGFAWAATRDGRMVIRGGAGQYFDPVSFNAANITRDRLALSPAGTGRRANIPGSAAFFQGRPLDFSQRPTTFTGADLLSILPGIREGLARQLNPDNRDYTFRNIDLDKVGQNLYDPFYETPYALHFNLGVQRELRPGLVLTADLALRRFLHTFLGGIDYNRFNRRVGGVQTPVIPRCTAAQRSDITAVCSAGPVTFDNTTGIAEYKGLLVRLEKRFSKRTQFLASYALGSFEGSNGPALGLGFNNDDWFENYGPLLTDLRHVLNVSGIVELPRRFQLSFNLSAYSRPPFSAYVGGVDFNGDGTTNDLLPGTRVNQFNRGLGRDDLTRLVESYNRQFAGRPTAGGQLAPRLELPADYAFGDGFFSQDLRLSRTFPIAGERARLILFGEVFNLFNTANLVGYGRDLANPSEFGRPGARSTQVFGSGGPRAFQFGARIIF
jgi:hypothetical protein